MNSPGKMVATLAAIAMLTAMVTMAFDARPPASETIVVLWVSAVPLILDPLFTAFEWLSRTSRLPGGIDLISLACAQLC